MPGGSVWRQPRALAHRSREILQQNTRKPKKENPKPMDKCVWPTNPPPPPLCYNIFSSIFKTRFTIPYPHANSIFLRLPAPPKPLPANELTLRVLTATHHLKRPQPIVLTEREIRQTLHTRPPRRNTKSNVFYRENPIIVLTQHTPAAQLRWR